MKLKFVASLVVILAVALVLVPGALGAEVKPGEDKGGASTFFLASVITAGFAMAIASAIAALAQSKAIAAALDGIARQPGAAGRIQIAMIIGLAMIESLAIYVLLVALILFFANPFIKYIIPGT